MLTIKSRMPQILILPLHVWAIGLNFSDVISWISYVRNNFVIEKNSLPTFEVNRKVMRPKQFALSKSVRRDRMNSSEQQKYLIISVDYIRLNGLHFLRCLRSGFHFPLVLPLFLSFFIYAGQNPEMKLVQRRCGRFSITIKTLQSVQR